ncbi:sn-glycerol-3-phosphate ABC transporter ATP-binding protein UgpC, partial [Bacteroides cellulosilyticus]
GEAMTTLKLDKVYKKYPNATQYSVEDFNLDVKDKEFIVFVGPSGCGKSTTLRMIAGLEDITEGEFTIDGKLMNDVAPKDRDIAMVFQNYALYPHMTVFDNMAFGLKLRKHKKDDIKQRVENAAKILGLTDLLDRKPADMSGGQRQRVAMGRAIVRDAKVFLMDEPLSNLDAKLRVSMRTEIAKIHRRIGATTIYVTHDQTEAMTLADRIVIMSSTPNADKSGTVGRIEQIGTPQELYNEPATKFVAGFIGSPAMNFLSLKIEGNKLIGEGISLTLPEGQHKLLKEKGYSSKEVIMGIRPEDISASILAEEAYPEAQIEAEVTVSELLGAETMLYLKAGDAELVSRVEARDFRQPGEKITVTLNLNKAHFFDKDTEVRIKEG